MEIFAILERFAGMDKNLQAWIFSTLLDFREQNLDEFHRRYGVVANTAIKALIEG